MPPALLSVAGVHKDYVLGGSAVHALRGVSFDVERGTFVTIMGPSGSGKSTLLHLVGALDRPTSGSLVFEGTDLAALDDRALTVVRRRRLGFVFQFFNLLPTMTAWENVALPRLVDGVRLGDVRDEAVALLDRVGLGGRVEHRPAQLSGGEMQRVAIARALVAGPALVLADEPTGNLDSRSGAAVLDLLRRAVDEDGRTVLMVTHDARAAAVGDRVLHLEDGCLVADLAVPPDAAAAPPGPHVP